MTISIFQSRKKKVFSGENFDILIFSDFGKLLYLCIFEEESNCAAASHVRYLAPTDVIDEVLPALLFLPEINQNNFEIFTNFYSHLPPGPNISHRPVNDKII